MTWRVIWAGPYHGVGGGVDEVGLGGDEDARRGVGGFDQRYRLRRRAVGARRVGRHSPPAPPCSAAS